MAEHVWEHLSEADARAANRLCFRYLKPGGVLRLAVPDGLHPDPGYIDEVRPGGTGAGVDDQEEAKPARATSDVVASPSKALHASAEAVVVAIRVVLAGWPSWGVRKVWAALRRDHGLRVRRRRVWSIMRAHGLVLVPGREPGEPPRGHVATPEPNRRLATDMTLAWTRRDGWVAVMP